MLEWLIDFLWSMAAVAFWAIVPVLVLSSGGRKGGYMVKCYVKDLFRFNKRRYLK